MNENDYMRASPHESHLFFKNGDLYLCERFKIYPKGGGCECGGGEQYTNISEHIRKIFNEELAKQSR